MDAIQVLKQAKNSIRNFDNIHANKLKMKYYKNLGYCFKKLYTYDLAKHYYLKYLQFALITNDLEAELKAYDECGIIFMYLNKLSMSKYLHGLVIQGKIEPP